MSFIIVTPLSRLEEIANIYQPRDMITLMNAGSIVLRPKMVEQERHLFLEFNDISEPQNGLIPPNENHVRKLLDFAQAWDQNAPLLVHCWMGISRSTATSYIIAAALNPKRDEEELALELRDAAPSATPNSRLITLADAMLKREGAMIKAITTIGRGRNAFEGTPFILKI